MGLGPYVFGSPGVGRRSIDSKKYFPEALDLITRALRAGHAFTTGLSMVGDEMPDRLAPNSGCCTSAEFRRADRPGHGGDFAERVRC